MSARGRRKQSRMKRITLSPIHTLGRQQVRSFDAITKLCPADRSLSGITEADVRLQLAEEDGEAHALGNISLHEVTPAGMMVEGLAIEEQQ